MKKLLVISVVFILLVAGAIAIFYQPLQSSNDGPKVAATIFPVYDITQQLAGDDIDVELILPPGASPHTFEPKASTLRDLRGAEAVYVIGHGLDNWAEGITDSLDIEQVQIENVLLREYEEDEEHHDEHEDEHENEDEHDDHHDDEHHDEHDEDHEDEHDHGHAHGDIDPHHWLLPRNGTEIAFEIALDLATRFPEHEEAIYARRDAYAMELNEMTQQVSELLSPLQKKEMITLHDAWYYLANEYGLEIVGTFEPAAGREPTPQYLAELTEAVEEHQVSVLYSEPQLGTAGLEGFAKDNGLTIVELDPLGGTSGRESYIDLLLYNAQVIAENQK